MEFLETITRIPLWLLFFIYLILIKLFVHALVIHMKKPLSNRCHMTAQWTIPVVCLHALYVAILVVVTAAVHHIEFRFDELRDLWRGILASAVSIGTFFLRHSIIFIFILKLLAYY